MRARAVIFAAILGLTAALAACKQGAGDTCQVDDDCDPPLFCNASTETCQRLGTGGDVDASPPSDAALPPDAGPDAAPPDAAVDPDGGAPDGGEPDATLSPLE
jgi:hypothetical protein